MLRICLFPGTFDPVTLGHTDIIDRALPLFDKLIIGIGRNVNKQPMFSEQQRLEWIKEICDCDIIGNRVFKCVTADEADVLTTQTVAIAVDIVLGDLRQLT